MTEIYNNNQYWSMHCKIQSCATTCITTCIQYYFKTMCHNMYLVVLLQISLSSCQCVNTLVVGCVVGWASCSVIQHRTARSMLYPMVLTWQSVQQSSLSGSLNLSSGKSLLRRVFLALVVSWEHLRPITFDSLLLQRSWTLRSNQCNMLPLLWGFKRVIATWALWKY